LTDCQKKKEKAVRHLGLAIAFVAASSLAAQAADITVYSPNIVNGPLQKLADAWTAETGNKVIFAGSMSGASAPLWARTIRAMWWWRPPAILRISRPS
jgi:ABC-type molybdate transport system substrate-binding protein